ncbi:hypothetical protein [Luteimonas sp. TWI1416]|uniref:hypothetical protein n=1 Tax=unclassified Luteimonas TaxID=2629088 RepID=UPI0032079C3F
MIALLGGDLQPALAAGAGVRAGLDVVHRQVLILIQPLELAAVGDDVHRLALRVRTIGDPDEVADLLGHRPTVAARR